MLHGWTAAGSQDVGSGEEAKWWVTGVEYDR